MLSERRRQPGGRWVGWVLIACIAIGARGEDVWIGATDGLWSTNLNWLDDSAPAAGGASDLLLRFVAGPGTTVTATNDLGGPFTLNRLMFDADAGATLTLASAPVNTIALSGNDPAMEISGRGVSRISSPLSLAATAGKLTIAGGETGSLTLSGKVSGTQAIRIRMTPLSPNVGSISLAGPNDFSGGVELDSGNLTIAHSLGLGTGVLTVRGGTLRLTGNPVANAIALETDLVIQSPGGSTLSGVISSAVPGTGIVMRNSSTMLVLTNASTYSGATTLDYSLNPQFADDGGGTLRFSGNGSALTSSAFRIRAGATLQLDPASGAVTNRIGDSTPIALRSSQLKIGASAPSGPATTEAVGLIEIAGYSQLTFEPSSRMMRLNAAGLSRMERGTMLIRGSTIGSSAGSNAALFASSVPLVGGGGTGPDTSIIPFAIGDPIGTGTGTTFATYDVTNGVRLLATQEYLPSLDGASLGKNVRLTAATEVLSDVSMNALVLDRAALTGSGSITIGSGALLHRSGGSIAVPLEFGAAEANIFSISDLVISSPISGTAGLTKSGPGKLTLSGEANWFGALTINAGLVGFTDSSALGADSSAIVLNGQGAGLVYAATGALILPRPIETRTGVAHLDTRGLWTIAAPITGAGGVLFSSSNQGTFVLAAANNYQGPTGLASGNVVISADSSFGDGGALSFVGGNLTLAGHWTTSREIVMTSASTWDTRGFDASLTGIVSGFGTLTKRGTGTLSIDKPEPFRGALTLAEGKVRLQNAQSFGTTILVQPLGGLVIDGSGVEVASQVSDDTQIIVDGGALTFLGSLAGDRTKTVGGLTFKSGDAPAIVDVSTPGNFRTVLRGTTIAIAAESDLVIRAHNLGGVAPGPFSRISSVALFTPSTGVNVIVTEPDGSGASFGTYDGSSDAFGTIGFRALGPAEYYSATAIQNPANGGTTPIDAKFLLTGDAIAIGSRNVVNSMTLAGAATITLSPSQTLLLAGSALISRGATTQFITGGTIDFGTAGGAIYIEQAMRLASTVLGDRGLRKIGPGMLRIDGIVGYDGGTFINEGTVIPGPENFRSELLHVNARGQLALQPGAVTLGGLAGNGSVTLSDTELNLGSHPRDMTFDGVISGTGSVTIKDGGRAYAARGLTGENAFGGNIMLRAGRLLIPSAGALGNGSLIGDGGALQPTADIQLTSSLVLSGGMEILGANVLTLPEGVAATGGGRLVLRGAGKLVVRAALDNTGDIASQYGVPGAFVPAPGEIAFAGPFGSALFANGFQIDSGTLTLDNTEGFTGGTQGRIADGAPVTLRSATWKLIGGAGATETVGELGIAGSSQLFIVPGNGAGARLAASSLDRIDRGTFLVRSTGLGTPLGANVGQITFALPPLMIGKGGSGVELSILPFAIGAASDVPVYSLVTYNDTTGIRPLDLATEFSAMPPSSQAANVRIQATVLNNSQLTGNSLLIEGGAALQGAGSFAVTSGVLLKSNSGSAAIENSLAFGGTEANLFVTGTTGSLSLTGSLDGSGGMTKSGSNDLVIRGPNHISGPLTVNDGAIVINSFEHLGDDEDSPIVIHGNAAGAGLTLDGFGSAVLARPIEIRSGFGLLRAMANSQVTVDGVISGSGGLLIAGTGVVELRNSNTYRGPTRLDGRLRIGSDAALGTVGQIVFRGTLALDGAWSTERPIDILQSSTLDTNGFDATWSGGLTATTAAVLTKAGRGELAVTNSIPFESSIAIAEGTVRLANHDVVRPPTIAVGPGTLSVPALVIDYAADTFTKERIATAGPINMTNGRLEFRSQEGGVRQQLALTFGADSVNTVRVVAPKSDDGNLVTLQISTGSGARLRVAGTDLANATRFVFAATPSLAAGLLPDTVADDFETGLGSTFATYDGSIRPLRSDEYVTAAAIQNDIHGGTTPGAANFRIVGSATAVGVTNNVNSLTLAPGSLLTLQPEQRLLLTRAGVVAQRGVGSRITGGTLVFGSNMVNFAGDGDLVVDSALSGNGGFAKWGEGTLTLTAPASYTGVFQILEGRLRFLAPDAFKFATFKLQGGAELDVHDVSPRIAGISGAGRIELGAGTLTLADAISTFAGKLSGQGGLTVLNNSRLTLSGVSDYGGVTRLSRETNAAAKPVVTLTGSGTLPETSAVTVEAGGTLSIENGTVQHLPEIPISLNDGALVFRRVTGSVAETVRESTGPLSIIGASRITISAVAAGPAQWMFSDLARPERGTLGLLYVANGLNVSNVSVLFGGNLSSQLIGEGSRATNQPILPFVVGTVGRSLATYDPGFGVRLLDEATEMSQTLTAGDNVVLSSSTPLATDVSINSLVLSSGSSLDGTGKLSIASGAVVVRNSASVGTAVEFGSAEGSVFVVNASLTFTKPVSGNNGLTVTGLTANPSEVVTLSAPNNFNGPLTVNSAAVRFAGLQNLGPGSDPIALNDASLIYNGTGPLTSARAIRTTGLESVVQAVTAPLTIDAIISGRGGMKYLGDITLKHANSYAGPTTIQGHLTIADDQALGMGNVLQLGSGALLTLTGPWITNRNVVAAADNVVINIGSFDATINGALSGDTALHKKGAGRLTLTGSNELKQLVIEEGELIFAGVVGGSYLIAQGATVRGDVSGANVFYVSGTIAPGSATESGVISAADIDFEHGLLALDLLSTTDYDSLSVGNFFTFDDPIPLVLTLHFDPRDGIDSFVIVRDVDLPPNAGNPPAHLSFQGTELHEADVFVQDDQAFRISYVGGNGNDIVLFPVPEPSVPLLAGVATFMLPWRRRDRKAC